MNGATNQEYPEFLTRRATFDAPLWLSGIAFWTLVAVATAMAVFGSESRRREVVTGTALVNKIGDVVAWNAEKATGATSQAMVFSDFFRIVPPGKRIQARMMFARATEGPPYSFHEVYWYDDGAAYSVRFTKDGDVYLATISKRR